jgi:hypothetical protein
MELSRGQSMGDTSAYRMPFTETLDHGLYQGPSQWSGLNSPWTTMPYHSDAESIKPFILQTSEHNDQGPELMPESLTSYQHHDLMISSSFATDKNSCTSTNSGYWSDQMDHTSSSFDLSHSGESDNKEWNPALHTLTTQNSLDLIPPPHGQSRPWTSTSSTSNLNDWGQQTVSPTALTLCRVATAISSPDSSNDDDQALSTSQSPLISLQTYETDASATSVVPRHEGQQTHQQTLPAGLPLLPAPTMLPSNDAPIITVKPRRTLLPRRLESAAGTGSSIRTGPVPQSCIPMCTKMEANSLSENKEQDAPSLSETMSLQRSHKSKPIQRRSSKDEFLVRSKLAGMSYKDIRKKGGFIEAESTLRGRYRTLTKDKAERVRKPEWEANDVSRQ